MAGRPGKTLEQLVRENCFRPGRHAELLETDALLRFTTLARIQQRYRVADHDLERREIAREFARAIPGLLERRRRSKRSLQEILASFGPPGSPEQILRFFPWAFRFHRGPKAGKRFHLAKHQERWVREFYGTRDRRGRRVYTRGLFGGPKGTGKTPFAGGLGHYHNVSLFDDAPLVFALAGSREQAGSDPDDLDRLHAIARKWAETEPLADYMRSGSSIRCLENGGVFRILTSEGRLAQGVDPTFWLIEEFWLFEHRREREAVNALLRSHKRGEGGVTGMAVSTAGWNKATPLGEMFDAAMKLADIEILEHGCLTIARDPASGFLMHWYAVPENGDIEDPKLLRAANPLPVVSVRDLLRDLRAPGTDERDWRRLNANQWTATKEAWLPAGVWSRLRSETKAPAGADVYLAIDAALTYDTTALTWASRRQDGTVLLETRVWAAREEAPHHVHVPGGRIRNRLLLDFIIGELVEKRRLNVREIVGDPRFIVELLNELAELGFVVAEFQQNSGAMADAYQHIYEEATAGTICWHDPQAVFLKHAEAAAAKKTERGWRVYKLQSWSPIDALVAAAMARERCAFGGGEPESSWRPL